ncbi:hypothetical protein D9M70_528890 [compost metagenome]
MACRRQPPSRFPLGQGAWARRFRSGSGGRRCRDSAPLRSAWRRRRTIADRDLLAGAAAGCGGGGAQARRSGHHPRRPDHGRARGTVAPARTDGRAVSRKPGVARQGPDPRPLHLRRQPFVDAPTHGGRSASSGRSPDDCRPLPRHLLAQRHGAGIGRPLPSGRRQRCARNGQLSLQYAGRNAPGDDLRATVGQVRLRCRDR